MLLHPTLEKLSALRLTGMTAALNEQLQMDLADLSFEERLGLLLDREMAVRETRKMKTRLQKAKLRQDSCLEDIDFRHPRGLDKSLVVRLADCQWLKEHHNLIITGPTGVGKTYLACAFAQKACREGFSTLYLRMTKLFEDLSLAKGDGRYLKLLKSFAKTDLLVLDDYGLVPLHQEQRHDLLKILEDRHGLKSTLVTSQLPFEHWHEQIGDPTLADAILDRLVNSGHKLQLEGDSLRKKSKLDVKDINEVMDREPRRYAPTVRSESNGTAGQNPVE